MSPPRHPRRQRAEDRKLRLQRIMARVQVGYSYAAIGREEGLSRERVREIVSDAVRAADGETIDLPRIQISRLEPALRLAVGAVANGDLKAIAPLLKTLSQIDKYNSMFAPSADQDESVREKLLIRLDRQAGRMLERSREEDPRGAGAAASGDPANRDCVDPSEITKWIQR